MAAAPGEDLERVAAEEGVATYPVPFEREIRPLADLLAIRVLRKVLRRFRPHLVNAGTPKAGLLAGLAARWAGVPARVYTLRGLRLETARGWRRTLLAAAERRAARSAHRVVCVSRSLLHRYAELGLAPEGDLEILGQGSSNGVDVERFRPRDAQDPEIAEWRRRLALPEGTPVIGFVGRWTRDKGIVDLAEALFGSLVERFPEARLLLVGAFESGDPVPAPVRDRLASDPRVIRPGFLEDVAPLYGLIDVLAFPSYREGFPNAPLEAAASGVPVAGYAVTGTVDAVRDGETGTLVPAGDAAALAEAIGRYLGDAALRREHGVAARSRVEREFRRELVWKAWGELYAEMLAERGLPLPARQEEGAES